LQPQIRISDDLTVAIGGSAVTLTPTQGLDLAEQLARKSFRRAMIEEARDVALNPEDGLGQELC
jgi:hypothetical protein